MSEADAVHAATRFVCRQTESEYPYIWVRPFSNSTHIDPGETITADFALDAPWLAALGRMIYVQSVAIYTPDEGGIHCHLDRSSETVFDIVHEKIGGPDGKVGELCWLRSENHLIRNPIAEAPAQISTDPRKGEFQSNADVGRKQSARVRARIGVASPSHK